MYQTAASHNMISYWCIVNTNDDGGAGGRSGAQQWLKYRTPPCALIPYVHYDYQTLSVKRDDDTGFSYASLLSAFSFFALAAFFSPSDETPLTVFGLI